MGIEKYTETYVDEILNNIYEVGALYLLFDILNKISSSFRKFGRGIFLKIMVRYFLKISSA